MQKLLLDKLEELPFHVRTPKQGFIAEPVDIPSSEYFFHSASKTHPLVKYL